MKKVALLLAVVIVLLFVSSCEYLPPEWGFGEQGGAGENEDKPDGEENRPDEENKPDDGKTDEEKPDDNDGEDPDGGNTDGEGENTGNEENGDSGDGEVEDDPLKDTNAALIDLSEVKGLNEQIYVKLTALDGFEYKVLYKKDGDTEYKVLDSELMFLSKGCLEFYILGISAGKYEIKIEAESEKMLARRTISDIDVAAQDRSGYAHFGYDEGIGAYNSDGTVKENAVILYVTNENKNTITMTINGVEYVGLVDILQKQHLSDVPLLIRVIGRISTNQWNYKNVEPRLVDGSNADGSFFENTFSTEFGENLIGLKVRFTDKKDGKTYTYRTTADGLGEVKVSGSGRSTTTYKGSDFPTLRGKTVYDDDSFINVIEVQAASNITIEGVGADAEFFQFGVGFEECNSIEVKNLTFTNYPEDALNFMVGADMGVKAFGNIWVHNNTFNKGYNAWDITGERDKYAGDGSIDMAFVHNVTVSYNFFNECKKTMLVGNSDSSRCMNVSIHHNNFYKVGSRLPLVRNTNVHSYNNYFDSCSTCASVRINSYLFSEANYYKSCSKPFDVNGGAVKSFGDIFMSCSSGNAVIASGRDQVISNNCKPDATTNYTKFDTDPNLFYYNAELGITDVDYLINAEDVPEFVGKYAGAGVMEKLEIAE